MTLVLHPLFPDVAFSDILSLGADCEAANGLRLVDRHRTRGLFDWLVTPLDAIAGILADDGARLGQRFIAVQDGTSARCDAYGVLYHHELPRDPRQPDRLFNGSPGALPIKIAAQDAELLPRLRGCGRTGPVPACRARDEPALGSLLG